MKIAPTRRLLFLLCLVSACSWFGGKKDKPVPTSSRRVWCEHEGVTYAAGTSRPDGDCATCTCVELDRERSEWVCDDVACAALRETTDTAGR